MAVPKMVKNGNNSLFTIHNRFCYPFGIHALKTDQNSERRIKTISARAIKDHLGKKKGVMLDIGANVGFFCHKFEDLGYYCYAIERDPATFRILEKVKIAENKKFEVINKSIFEVEFIKNVKFDVVLALNIFHHFLKRKTDYLRLKDLLRNLETAELFFEPHLYHEDQMREAYVNYTETEFIDFILSHTSLNKSELIYTAKNGRHVFKLSK